MTVSAPRSWESPRQAAQLLANLGFFAHSDLPDRAGPAYLLVALRGQPTLRHFDPEVVEFWVDRDGRGAHERVTRANGLPIDREFSWGPVRITDRLGVTNDFLAFGGRVRAEMIDDVVVVVFTSPAPILRRGGHSQGLDMGADHLGAFFSRLLLAVDFVPDFERQAAEAEVLARYAAFLDDAARRFGANSSLREASPEACQALQTEVRRIQSTHAADWQAGRDLVKVAVAGGLGRSASSAV